MKPRRYLIFLLLIPMLMLNGCVIKMYEEYQESHRKPTTAMTEETTTKEERLKGEVFGVVTQVNTADKVVTVRDINTNALVEYFYSGSTDVRDKYGEILAMGLIKPGDMVDGTYFIDNNYLNTLTISADAWSNLRVHNWAYDRDTNRIRIGTKTYTVYDFCVVTQDGEAIDIRELASIDELIVRGYGDTVYSIDVLKGHGYLSLQNESFFVGGIVTVGNEVGLEVTEDMLIMAEEGKHILSITKAGVGGAVEVDVIRGKEILVDVGGLSGEAVVYGSISFSIEPEGAKLYIDGRAKDYDGLVELAFGTYRIAVEAEGYAPYIGDLVVGDTFMRRTISLGLAEEKETTEPDKEEPATSGDSEKETTSTVEESTADNAEEPTTEDITGTDMPFEEEPTVIYTGDKDISKYNIYIESPVGAEVYFDSEYVGIAPLNFEKQSGLHTIIFKRDGYQMKAYVMEISAEACDEYFSFLPLEKTEE